VTIDGASIELIRRESTVAVVEVFHDRDSRAVVAHDPCEGKGTPLESLATAFPMGLPETGFRTPIGDTLTKEARAAANTEVTALLDEGATAAELQQWAKQKGMRPFGKDLDELVAQRDGKAAEELAKRGVDPSTLPEGMTPKKALLSLDNNQGLADEASSFKGTPEPTPEEVFKTPEQKNVQLESSLKAEAASRPSSGSYWREAGADKAGDYFPGEYAQTHGLGGDSTYLADKPELAIGQGGKGVLLEFDKDSLKATPHKKPGSVFNEGTGQEYVGNNLPREYQSALKSVHISKEAFETAQKESKKFDYAGRGFTSGIERQLESLEKQGWVREETPTGFKYTRPEGFKEEPYAQDLKPNEVDPARDQKLLQQVGLTDSHFASPEEAAAFAKKLREGVLGETPLDPASYEGPVRTDIPSEEGGLTKRKANALFKEETTPTRALTPRQMEAKIKGEADAFLASREGATPEPLPEPQRLGVEAGEPIPATEVAKDASPAPTAPLPPIEDTVTKLTAAINSAAGIEAKVQRRLYHNARRERLAEASRLRESIGGEEGLNAALGALKGELPKAKFEGVQDQFTHEEVKSLFDHVSGNLSGFEAINAQVGLRKLLTGQLPTASEIKLLDKIFPPSFTKTALKHRSFTTKALEGAANALNLPRALMSTFDLSAPFTQGVFLVGRKEFWGSFSSMFKSFGHEKAFEAVQDSIRHHPNYPWMEEAKLAIADIHGSLPAKEEKFMSKWAEEIPLVGRVVKASERGYTAFLNKLRADTFNSIFEKAKAAGIKPEDDPKFLTDLGKFINNATGRGDLGIANSAAPLLSGLLFSPRLMASRVNMLRPDVYVRLHPAVRKEALKSLISFGGITTTALLLAKAGGAEVETDPRSSDFAKIRTGNTRYNILGGFGTYLVLGSRLATNEKKTIAGEEQELGKKFGSSSRLGVVGEFGRSKLSPVASFVADYLDGKDMTGEDFDMKTAIVSRFTPMLSQDVADLVKEEGAAKGAVMAVPAVFGINAQTYGDRRLKGLPSTVAENVLLMKEKGATPEEISAYIKAEKKELK